MIEVRTVSDANRFSYRETQRKSEQQEAEFSRIMHDTGVDADGSGSRKDHAYDTGESGIEVSGGEMLVYGFNGKPELFGIFTGKEVNVEV